MYLQLKTALTTILNGLQNLLPATVATLLIQSNTRVHRTMLICIHLFWFHELRSNDKTRMFAMVFVVCAQVSAIVNSHICNWYIYDLPNCDVDIGFDFELCLCSPKVECGPSPNACCTEYEQQPVDIVQYRLFSFVLHHWLCSLHAHCSRQTNQTPISKIAKMNYSIRFCAIDLIVPSSQLYSIHFHAFRRQYPVWLFMFFFSFFTQKQETLQHSVRTLQSSDFFLFFLRHLLHFYQCRSGAFGLNWERSVFLKCKMWSMSRNYKYIEWPQKSNLMWIAIRKRKQ